MELELKMDIDDSKQLTEKVNKVFKIATEKCGLIWLNATKQILQNKDATDTGEFINSIHYTVRKQKDAYVMTGRDAVKYGIYIEKGTVKHWVPFYKYVGDYCGRAIYDTSQPILADWGRRVLGLSEYEMLEMGGIKVSHSGTNAFEIGLTYVKHAYQQIFQETFNEYIK